MAGFAAFSRLFIVIILWLDRASSAEPA